ncbi:TPA: CO dehydrogenase/acetyl-CoA synthase subunit delta, partial [Candidatus Bathyarchaeota archaeon]|nr:CO dehydrogenase/acetyl-CoA synthase subunit delta [Candidatus Bathyarchaeota archaeon]
VPRLGRIVEVKIGATKGEGGTRGKTVTIGGEKELPFFSLKEGIRDPVLALQVLDKPIGVPTSLAEELGALVNDPVKWAKAGVEKFKADAVAVKLISAHPTLGVKSKINLKDFLKRLIRAIEVPLIICAPGSPEKDGEVLEEAAEASRGEGCALASATLNNEYRRIVEAAVRHGHSVVAETGCDPSLQRSLNERLLEAGLPKDKLLMDPTSAALGLGIEYSISIIEQLKLAALTGDEPLQAPITCIRAPAYSWSAREAWAEDPKLGPREVRGPLWEAVTALSLFLAGANLLVLAHPRALVKLKWFLKVKEGSN